MMLFLSYCVYFKPSFAWYIYDSFFQNNSRDENSPFFSFIFFFLSSIQGSSSGQTNGTSSTQAVRTLVPTHIEVPNTAPSMPSSRPGLGPRPAAPLFPAGVKTSTAGGGTGSSRASFPQFATFSSFQPTSNAASTAAAPAVQVPSFQEDKDDPAVVRRRQAEERQRMIAQLQQEEDDD